MSGIHMLLGAGGRSFAPTIVTIGDFEPSPTNPQASLSLQTDGTLTTVGNACNAGSNWTAPTLAGIGTGYWARLTINSGSAPSSGSATGAWLQLNALRSWAWTRAILGITSATCTLEISPDAAGAVILIADSFTVNCEMA